MDNTRFSSFGGIWNFKPTSKKSSRPLPSAKGPPGPSSWKYLGSQTVFRANTGLRKSKSPRLLTVSRNYNLEHNSGETGSVNPTRVRPLVPGSQPPTPSASGSNTAQTQRTSNQLTRDIPRDSFEVSKSFPQRSGDANHQGAVKSREKAPCCPSNPTTPLRRGLLPPCPPLVWVQTVWLSGDALVSALQERQKLASINPRSRLYGSYT